MLKLRNLLGILVAFSSAAVLVNAYGDVKLYTGSKVVLHSISGGTVSISITCDAGNSPQINGSVTGGEFIVTFLHGDVKLDRHKLNIGERINGPITVCCGNNCKAITSAFRGHDGLNASRVNGDSGKNIFKPTQSVMSRR